MESYHVTGTYKQLPSLLFLPDWFTESGNDWKGQLPFVQNHFHCIWYDLVGQDGGEEREPLLAANLRDLSRYIAGLDTEVCILAHGISCILALQLAEQLPKKIRCLTLVSPRHSYGDLLGLRLLAFSPRFFLPLVLFFWDPLGERLPSLKRWSKRCKAFPSAVVGSYASDLLKVKFRDGLKQIFIPVLLLAGDRDPLKCTKHAEYINEKLPHSELIRYAHLGHSPQREEPVLVNNAIYEFLREAIL